MNDHLYPVPYKRDIESACLLVNGLTAKQRAELLTEAINACAYETRNQPDVLNPYLNGFLIGYMVREVQRNPSNHAPVIESATKEPR